MIQIKKTILTLVALLAVTTGAWAEEQSETIATTATIVEGTHFTISNNDDYADSDGMTAKSGITVTPKNGETITKVVISCTWDPGHVNNGNTSVSSGTKEITNGGGTITVTGVNASTFTFTCSNGDPEFGQFVVYYTEASVASSGPEVAWDKAAKTGTFTMPGGNVTLEPEYFPQAALTAAPTAINDVPATTDGAIVKAGTVANIGSTETAQGTVMYYVSTTALDDAALLALAADQWTADVPTAEKLAQGKAYVYYYVRGNDSDTDEENFSDGDILAANALTVTIAAEPTYAVTFADDLAEPTLWTASPNADVTKGQTVTVTYSGTKKVIGVKAEKKAAEPVADIVWDVTNVSDLSVSGTYQSYEKEGITLSGNADQIQAKWRDFGDPTKDGISFDMRESGGFTFTAPTGKAFTKIEMTLNGSDAGWDNASLGTGWARNADWDKNIFTVTWTGSAASTVGLLTGADDFDGEKVKSIAFYLSE